MEFALGPTKPTDKQIELLGKLGFDVKTLREDVAGKEGAPGGKVVFWSINCDDDTTKLKFVKFPYSANLIEINAFYGDFIVLKSTVTLGNVCGTSCTFLDANIEKALAVEPSQVTGKPYEEALKQAAELEQKLTTDLFFRAMEFADGNPDPRGDGLGIRFAAQDGDDAESTQSIQCNQM